MKSAGSPKARAFVSLAHVQKFERLLGWLRLGTFTGVLLIVGLLSLSDNVGSRYIRAASAAKNLVFSYVPASGSGLAGAVDLPVGIDTALHFVVWTSVSFLALTLRPGFISRANVLLGLLALSASIEVGQEYLSMSRTAELSDALANAAGIGVGALAAGPLLLLASVLRSGLRIAQR